MKQIDITRVSGSPTVLYEENGHAIYWLGIDEPTAFRTNTYLIRDGNEALIVDPGNRAFFPQVRERVAQIMKPEAVSGLIVCHQDPDVAASMNDWLEVNPAMRVYTTPRTQVLLPHYGRTDYRYVDVEENPALALPSGAELKFIPAPFLHFPGAFTTFDAASGSLLSGDVFASLGTGERLMAGDFEELAGNMGFFHVEYMASNIAARGFVASLDGLDIKAILPQHGQIIGEEFIADAMQWLAELHCGTDIIYPELS